MKPKHRTHKHRRNRQRRTLLMRFSDLDRPLKVLILVELTLTVLLVTLLLLRHSLPSALPVRLTFAAAVCLPILFFSLHRKWKPSPVGQVLNILSAVKLTAAALLTIPRLFALGTALLLVIHAAYLLRLLLRQDRSEALLLQLCLCLLEAISTVATTQTYTYQNTVFPFWPVSLAVALILTAASVCTLIRKGYVDWREDLLHLACACVAALFVGGFLAELTIGNLNYALDTTPATEITSTVLDKRATTGSGRGSLNHHYLTVTVNGRPLEVEVPSSLYKATEKGDTVTVHLGNGAFGQEYCYIE